MKHLQKFNEISTGLSRNAYNAGSDKLPDHTDPIRRYKILKQNTKFQTYINPSLKEYLLRQGALDAQGYDEGISIRIPSKYENENSVWIKITKDRRSEVFNHRAEIETVEGEKFYMVLGNQESFLAKLDLV